MIWTNLTFLRTVWEVGTEERIAIRSQILSWMQMLCLTVIVFFYPFLSYLSVLFFFNVFLLSLFFVLSCINCLTSLKCLTSLSKNDLDKLDISSNGLGSGNGGEDCNTFTDSELDANVVSNSNWFFHPFLSYFSLKSFLSHLSYLSYCPFLYSSYLSYFSKMFQCQTCLTGISKNNLDKLDISLNGLGSGNGGEDCNTFTDSELDANVVSNGNCITYLICLLTLFSYFLLYLYLSYLFYLFYLSYLTYLSYLS